MRYRRFEAAGADAAHSFKSSLRQAEITSVTLASGEIEVGPVPQFGESLVSMLAEMSDCLEVPR